MTFMVMMNELRLVQIGGDERFARWCEWFR
jgi:hypothetical protein